MVILFDLQMQSEHWADLLTAEAIEILSEVKTEYENAQFLVSKPSGKRMKKPKLKAPAKKSDPEDPVESNKLDLKPLANLLLRTTRLKLMRS